MTTLQDARKATAAIVKTIKPISVILFGSVARIGQGNDLDLLIVVKDEPDTVRKTLLTLSKKLKTFYCRYAVDPFVVTEKTFNEYFYQGSPFLQLIAKEGKTMYMKNFFNEWMQDARQELDMARLLRDNDYYRGSAYHAQQALEKMLKANLLKKGWVLEKTHNIARLLAICREYKLNISIKDQDIIFIDSIYRGRYPAEAGLLPLKEPSQDDADHAIKIADRVLKQLTKKS